MREIHQNHGELQNLEQKQKYKQIKQKQESHEGNILNMPTTFSGCCFPRGFLCCLVFQVHGAGGVTQPSTAHSLSSRISNFREDHLVANEEFVFFWPIQSGSKTERHGSVSHPEDQRWLSLTSSLSVAAVGIAPASDRGTSRWAARLRGTTKRTTFTTLPRCILWRTQN